MAKILAALTGRDWTLERQALGRRPTTHSPTTWLTELRALPRPGTTFPWVGSYLQEWFSAEFRSQTDFEVKSEALSGQRIYRELDRAKAPAITFFYGLPARHWAERHLSSLLRDDFSTEEVCSVARTKQGTLLISTGFYDGRHAESAFREHQIPALTETIRRQLTDRAVAALSTPRSRRT